ncbi:MAG: Gfo/Idh/MocA family oxidoreductase [Actinomycetota bacterium]
MLKTAQVGLGWWGQQVTQCLQDSAVIKIVCGVDPVPASAEKYTATFGLPVVPEFGQVLADPKIEAVILTTPHGVHEQQVVAAAAAGKQILCEKPLALTAESARRMIEACDRAGILLGLGHERRFEPAWEEIKRMVDAGELGTVLHVEGDFSHDRFLNMTADNWRGSKKEAPAAGMTGMGVHLTDMLLSMVGPVVEVHAVTAQRVIPIPTGDVVSVHLRFSDGTTGHVAAVSATPFYGRLAVFGSHGWAEARDTQHTDPGGPVHFFTRRRGDAEQAVRTFEPRNVVKANYEEWAVAAMGKGSYRFTDQERFGNVALLEAIVRSAEQGTLEQVAQYKG